MDGDEIEIIAVRLRTNNTTQRFLIHSPHGLLRWRRPRHKAGPDGASMRECSENVLLQSAKRLWTRASANEKNAQDYLNTLSAQLVAICRHNFFSGRTPLMRSKDHGDNRKRQGRDHSTRVVRVDRVSLCGRRY